MHLLWGFPDYDVKNPCFIILIEQCRLTGILKKSVTSFDVNLHDQCDYDYKFSDRSKRLEKCSKVLYLVTCIEMFVHSNPKQHIYAFVQLYSPIKII